MENQDNKKLGILYILGSAFGFATMALLVRLAGDLPTFEKAFFRNIIATFFALYMLKRVGEKIEVKKQDVKALLWRSICGSIGIICNFYALDHMPIADATILNKLSPFAAILASWFLLREKPVKMDIFAIIIAFIGAAFVAKPSLDTTLSASMIALLGGVGAGAAYTFVRMLTKQGVGSIFIVFFFSLFSTLCTLPFMIGNFFMPNLSQLLILLGAGMAAMVGQICVTKAYGYAPAKEISVYDYVQVVYAAAYGFFIFGELPDIYSIIGYILIIGIAIVKWRWRWT